MTASVAGPPPGAQLHRLVEDSLRWDPARSLESALYDVAETAGHVLGAQYAAITVLGPGGRTEVFVPYGVDVATARQIGAAPSHRGLLGVVVEDCLPIRVRDAATDPRAAGVPPHHPLVGALVGVPIMLRGRAAGGLFVAQPLERDEFSEVDERTAETIASAAANVIERARTAAENARRDRWLTGAAELTRELASGRYDAPFELVVQRLLRVADADVVTMVQPGPSDGTLIVRAAAGDRAERLDGAVLQAEGTLSAPVLADGRPRNVSDMLDTWVPDELRALTDTRTALLIPISGTSGRPGVLCIGRREGKARFTSGEMGMATMFAGQVALALELAEAQERRDQLALVEERDRIARDLHDHVIQRLFAIGLTMQSIGATVPDAAGEQLGTSVDEIDNTINQIRSTIYHLTTPIVSQATSLRAQAARLLDELEPAFGFRPGLTVHGPVDFGIDEDMLDDCMAVLREALTNVARHAAATRCDVVVNVDAHVLTLEVNDNGKGLGAVRRRSGLANMRTRAERRRGGLTVVAGATGGTRLQWSVPVVAVGVTLPVE